MDAMAGETLDCALCVRVTSCETKRRGSFRVGSAHAYASGRGGQGGRGR